MLILVLLFALPSVFEWQELQAATNNQSSVSTRSVSTVVADGAEDGPHLIYLSFMYASQPTPSPSPSPVSTMVNRDAVTPTIVPTMVLLTSTSTSTPSPSPSATLPPTATPSVGPTTLPTTLPTAIPPATVLPTTMPVSTISLTLTSTVVAIETVIPTGTVNPTATNVVTVSLTATNVVSVTETPTAVPTINLSTTASPTVSPTITSFSETPVVETATPTMEPTLAPTVAETVTATGTAGTISLPNTPTPTVMLTPTATLTPTVTLAPTVTPTATELPSTLCSITDLIGLSSSALISSVQADADCADPFVELLIDDPATYFDAFYALVPSTDATEALWWSVYNAMSRGEFLFSAEDVENLWANLPAAASACVDHARCQYWTSYMVEPLLRGEMYRCPELATLSAEALLESIPYGNYYCTADSVNALVPIIDEASIEGLLVIAADREQGWSRRNGLRVLGRIAERGAADPAGELVLDTLADDVKAMLLTQLPIERNAYPLEDLMWIVDSHFYPFFEAQPALETIAKDVTFADTVTFRSMAAITRLLVMKDGLLQDDLDFVTEQLSSAHLYVRTQAARSLTVLEPNNVGAPDTVQGDAERLQIMTALADQLAIEDDFMVRIAMQEALDLYAGTDEVSQMQAEYEAENLAATLEDAPITIRSGLAQEELPAFLARMQATELTFFDVLGESFRTPVPGDPTEAMTLLLFETRTAYQQYMDAFVGFGSHAGGLYIERDATLYTYQRTAAESSFTIEHLVQHEFTHYLNGRYVFPDLWTDPGFHDQPKGWIDEGAAEYFGLTIFEDDGSYTQPLAEARLSTICANDMHSGIQELINRRLGYDQAGIFDYDYAWAFLYYLFQQRPAIALRVFDEYRAETYDVTAFAAVAGVPSIESLEVAWHSTIDGWCDSRNQLRAAGGTIAGAWHDTHESQIMSHIGTIYTVPLPPLQSTGTLGDGDEVIRLITSE